MSHSILSDPVPTILTSHEAAAPAPDHLLPLLGGKASNLVRLGNAGGRVPGWFCVTTRLFDQVVDDLRDRSDEEIFAEGRQLIEEWSFPDSLRDRIAAEIEHLGSASGHLAVRSSAVVEDGSTHSFAGQFRSLLGVEADGVVEAVRSVWLSACDEQVLAYLAMNGLEPRIPSIAVIVQQMIPADTSGVAFGCDPVTGDRETVVISSVYGLGEGLVSGDLDADTFRVERDGNGEIDADDIERTVASKAHRYVASPSGAATLTREEVPHKLRDIPSLDDDSILAIARLVSDLGEKLGAPQDVEWAIADGELYALQTRPVTTLTAETGVQDEGGPRYVWDNANIIESYSGVTTPLTFSFIEGVYSEVYRELTRILGVSDETIDANHAVFSMLGLIRGRVYYNLLNWYRVLALLPGYRVNARFMEGMMGVSERLEEQPQIVPPRGLQLPRLLRSIRRLVTNYRRLDREIATFRTHLDDVLAPYEHRSLAAHSPAELVGIYRTLEEQLLQRWRTPILNDFYTMIFHGLLRKMVPKIEGEEEGRLQNDLLVGEGGIVSTEPMRMLAEIAEEIRRDDRLTALIASSPVEGFRAARSDDHIGPMINRYLERFGSRVEGELRLETITLAENPELLAETLRAWVVQEKSDDTDHAERLRHIREEAEHQTLDALGRSPRRAFFRRILKAARHRIRWRENLRFERTRLFAVVRSIFLALGEHFENEGVIERRRDIFYLTIDEAFALARRESEEIEQIFGGESPTDRIARRVEEFEHYRATNAPPDRFESVGHPTDPDFRIVEDASTEQIDPIIDPIDDAHTLRGLACSPGRVRAPVRIVHDPNNPGPLAGHIMVAERTDPGWGPLFPLAVGLLVERGSLLSHSAIVAREMGIPAIVAVPNLMTRLVDGEIVEFDGQTGIIRRIASDENSDTQSEIDA